MKIFGADAAPREIADSKTFVGPAHTQRLASDHAGTPVGIYRVDFEDGGRTNWHTHSGAQWLLIVEGHVRVQKAGEPPRDVAAGDAVVIEPGEKHWHGAAPGSRGAHLAVNVAVTTDWLEPVSDDQYNPR
jgi:quercetin dioxygenase-like cupin family protein